MIPSSLGSYSPRTLKTENTAFPWPSHEPPVPVIWSTKPSTSSASENFRNASRLRNVSSLSNPFRHARPPHTLALDAKRQWVFFCTTRNASTLGAVAGSNRGHSGIGFPLPRALVGEDNVRREEEEEEERWCARARAAAIAIVRRGASDDIENGNICRDTHRMDSKAPTPPAPSRILLRSLRSDAADTCASRAFGDCVTNAPHLHQ
mmetsp:Transcript_24226/g.45311  ORF Transcript_24226/g.45311 Transcript_24226/m.45311 type:complete len:206 (-) Transcript_24226:100-717(-)